MSMVKATIFEYRPNMVYITHYEPFTFTAHVHPHVVIILMREGSTTVYVGGECYTLAPPCSV